MPAEHRLIPSFPSSPPSLYQLMDPIRAKYEADPAMQKLRREAYPDAEGTYRPYVT